MMKAEPDWKAELCSCMMAPSIGKQLIINKTMYIFHLKNVNRRVWVGILEFDIDNDNMNNLVNLDQFAIEE